MKYLQKRKTESNYKLIIFAGAPGSGKTTICELLQKELNSPLIDFGYLREWHLDPKWKNANAKEEQMAFENLVYVLKNYIKNGYRNILVNDLMEDKVAKLAKIFQNRIIISLVLDESVLRKRVVNPKRDSGFRDVEKAVKWNTQLKKRKLLENEIRVDNSHSNPKKTVKELLLILKKR
jgi:adenylate kinase family enzyme